MRSRVCVCVCLGERVCMCKCLRQCVRESDRARFRSQSRACKLSRVPEFVCLCVPDSLRACVHECVSPGVRVFVRVSVCA